MVGLPFSANTLRGDLKVCFHWDSKPTQIANEGELSQNLVFAGEGRCQILKQWPILTVVRRSCTFLSMRPVIQPFLEVSVTGENS